MKRFIILLILVPIMVAGVWYNNQTPAQIIPLERGLKRSLTEQIAKAVITQEPIQLKDLPRSGSEVFVALSLSNGERLFRSVGWGEGWSEAISAAIAKVSRGEAFSLRWLRVDFLEQKLPSRVWHQDKLFFDRPIGTIGLMASESPDRVWLPIDLVIERKWDKKGFLNKKHFRKKIADRIVPFETSAFAWVEENVVELYRAHRVWPEATNAQDLRSALQLAEGYLNRVIGTNGRYEYAYDPLRNRGSSKYNILRHAGTTWSLLQLYQFTQNEESLSKAELALESLAKDTVKCPASENQGLCVEEAGSVKLGANGLALLAMALHHKITGSPKYMSQMQGYARRIQEIQLPTGEFSLHKQGYPNGKDSGFVSGYYPGEAIFGLTALYEIDGNPEWLETAKNGAKWLITVRDADKTTANIAHDHWLLYGLERLDALQSDPIYKAQTEKIVEAIVTAQNLEGFPPDEIGSWYSEPRSTPAATRVEGLMAAYRLFKRHGDEGQLRKIAKTAEKSIRYQLATQFWPETAMFVSDPPKVLGGFRESLKGFTIRIDFVQHNASAMLDYLRLINPN